MILLVAHRSDSRPSAQVGYRRVDVDTAPGGLAGAWQDR
jgi:hypothetical protein